VIRWFGTNTDIEAQRQAIAERDAALEAAAQASRAKDEFLAMLGHELRNPLSPIVTALKLMERRGAASREQEVIQRQVDHLSRLVDDLLDIARITQGKLELRQEPIEIATVVLRGLESASPLLERRAQRVRMDVPAEGLMVSGDRDRLAQVVSNLLTNACKFSEPGAEVFVSAERDGRVIRLRVRDHGIGIAPEMLDRIFGTFVQQRQNIDRAGGGLGLGLSIVQNLVQLHQGTVYARSGGAGTGSEFIVELPALSAMPLDVSEERSVGAAGERRAPGSRRARVLVVDDNQDAADMLGDFLTGLGLDVRVAHDPLSALGVAADFKPEIALIDIGLPVMDGWELGRKLRALLGDDQPKLIAVTGYGQDRDRQQSAANGFAAHLTKPVDLGAVEKLITV
jgi:nitrogen-specific signal transduction histidine kinase